MSSAALAARVDEIQYRERQGPCLDTLRDGAIVQMDDLTLDRRREAIESRQAAHRLARIRHDAEHLRARIADAKRRADVRIVRSTARIAATQETLRPSATRSDPLRPGH
ncbi:hypothetical protein [Dactylosporangium sp. NPDC051541]|uniref:hypothetical protein n=1 Tax=Dactylosporangium sp. NPDC051541 TaxID=3363977 RepID=UPI0037A5C128